MSDRWPKSDKQAAHFLTHVLEYLYLMRHDADYEDAVILVHNARSSIFARALKVGDSSVFHRPRRRRRDAEPSLF